MISETNIKPVPRPKSWADALVVVPPVLNECKPLAIGTRYALQKLKAPGVSNRAIARLLVKHTSRQRYYMAVISETHRYALSGAADSLITESQREYSRRKLEAEIF